MSLPEIDTLLFFFINSGLQNSLLDIFMPFITDRSYVFYAPFFIYFLFRNRNRALTVLVIALAAILLGDWLSHELKHVFERMRPCNALDQVRLLKGCGRSFSMPSNHAVNAFAFATPFLVLFRGRLRFAFLIIAMLVAASRVYVGVHYPSDVIVGGLLGSIIALSVIALYRWSSVEFGKRPYETVMYLSLLAISLFRIYYILHGPLDLSPDEAHYWEWSRRPDLSYYSKGPMIAYLIFIGTKIFGDQVLGIRIMAVIFSLLSSFFLYQLGKRLYDERAGVFSALLLQVIPLFSAFGVIFTIDSPFVFFWASSLYLFWKAIEDPPSPLTKGEDVRTTSSWWILLGLSVGLGLLTKYTMALFYVCAFLFLVLAAEKRRVLLSGGPYIAFVISLLVFSPVLIWNAKHDWVTLRHTAGQAHLSEGFQISPESLIEFLGSQFGVITPLLLVFMAVALWQGRKTSAGKFLIWFSVPVIGFFLLKSVQGKVQANWALPGYIAGVAAFSSYYVRKKGSLRNGKKALLNFSIALALIVTTLAHYPSVLDLPVNVDPSARLTGWKELGREVTGIYEEMSAEHPVFIFSDRYQISSELAFYVKGHPVTYCVNLGRRMNQYDLWPGFGERTGHNAIFVGSGDAEIPEKVASAFGKVEKRVFTAYTKKRAKIRDYSLFLCYDFKGLPEEKPGRF
ncbi:MAG: glycosyltransferase family 39 protein [Nitrospirota bacterium]